MNAWLLSLDPIASNWLDQAAFAVVMQSFTVWVLVIAERQHERDRREFFDAHPNLRNASNIDVHSVVETVVMWDVERAGFVARCPEVSDLSGRGDTVDDACKALQKSLYERAQVGTLRRDMKIVATRSLEVYVAQDVPGANGAAACSSC